MPHLSGIDVIQKAKALDPYVEAVVLTGKSSTETAIAALRHGAFDYLTKPCRLADLERLLQRIFDKREMANKYRALKRRIERLEGSPKLVGNSPQIERIRKLTAKVSPTDSTVLIRGETGTGKELVALAVHDASLRSEMPFVAINCGALPESLIESELFGHRRGAFTGADEHRVGLFEVAQGGTVFLDEIGELPKAMQAKLLRFLESGEIRRVGENQSFVVDVRIVCATHRPLEEMVEEGDFREDLFYRINTFEIPVPPLRERSDDIAQLAQHLLSRFRNASQGKMRLTPAALEMLTQHSWPGNVRELANVIEHAVILSDDDVIDVDQLPGQFASRKVRGHPFKLVGRQSLREIELQVIQQVLERHQGNKPKTAKELGVSLKTLYNKLNQISAQTPDQSAA
jgi:two-component system NtrC family response regulator